MSTMLAKTSITCNNPENFIEEMRFKLCKGWRITEIKVEDLGDRKTYIAYYEQK